MDTTFNVGLEFSNKSMKKEGTVICYIPYLQQSLLTEYLN